MNAHLTPTEAVCGRDRRASWSVVTVVVAGTALAAILYRALTVTDQTR